MFFYFLFGLLSLSFNLYSLKCPIKYEGILASPITKNSNITHLAPYFLPYNPIIVDIGGYEGQGTECLLNYCKHGGQVIIFEPNPNAYHSLISRFQAQENVFIFNLAVSDRKGSAKLFSRKGDLDERASLLVELKNTDTYSIDVSCVILDEWCEENQLEKIDFLKMDVEGYELQILKSSPKILKTVKVICTKTNLKKTRKNITVFSDLKNNLEKMGFEMLAHWYQEGLQGEATFIRKEIYDALFR